MGLRTGTFHENYAQDMAIFPTKLHWGFLLAFLIILFACPLFFSDRILTLLTMMGIAVISVHGLNILTGFCDQISIPNGTLTTILGPLSLCPACNKSHFTRENKVFEKYMMIL